MPMRSAQTQKTPVDFPKSFIGFRLLGALPFRIIGELDSMISLCFCGSRGLGRVFDSSQAVRANDVERSGWSTNKAGMSLRLKGTNRTLWPHDHPEAEPRGLSSGRE